MCIRSSFLPGSNCSRELFSGVEIVEIWRRILWEMAQQASGQLRRIGLPDTVLNQRVSELSIGRQQLVLISGLCTVMQKYSSRRTHFYSSTPNLRRCFVLSGVKGQGKSVLYISPRMDEILRLADTITVLATGMLLPTWRLRPTKKIINLMSGRNHQDIYKERMIDRQQPLHG